MATRRRKKYKRRRRTTLPEGKLTVAEAAKLIRMTTSGVYAAIKNQGLPASRIDGQLVIDRAAAREYRRQQLAFLRGTKRKQTDAEWLQQMLDDDPA